MYSKIEKEFYKRIKKVSVKNFLVFWMFFTFLLFCLVKIIFASVIGNVEFITLIVLSFLSLYLEMYVYMFIKLKKQGINLFDCKKIKDKYDEIIYKENKKILIEIIIEQNLYKKETIKHLLEHYRYSFRNIEKTIGLNDVCILLISILGLWANFSIDDIISLITYMLQFCVFYLVIKAFYRKFCTFCNYGNRTIKIEDYMFDIYENYASQDE